jgi:glutaredoxin
MILRAFLLVLFVAAAAAVGVAHAQQYRWTDAQGRVHLTDTPPPASAKNVRRIETGAAQSEAAPLPFEVARLQKDFPVTLYTAPTCKDNCEQARAALNRRSVPFGEIQVWDADTAQKMKSVTGSDQVPALMVGRKVQIGFDQGNFDSLLSSAGYPATGVYPARNQAAPALPEGYIGPDGAVAKPAATKAAPAAKAGPYDPSGLTGPPPKTGQYDPSGLTGPPPRPGQYGIPGERK